MGDDCTCDEQDSALVTDDEFLFFRRRAVTGAGDVEAPSSGCSSLTGLDGLRRNITGVEWVLGLAG